MESINYNVQLNLKAHQLLWDLDKKLIGTSEYMGLAYFWDHEVKHTMRDATTKFKKAVHDTALKNGLDFTKGYVKTDQKLQDIISKMLKNQIILVEFGLVRIKRASALFFFAARLAATWRPQK